MPPPLVIGGLLLLKKLITVSAYTAVKEYGVPRAFRRCAEANRRLTPLPQQRAVAAALKHSFRAPGDAAHALMRSDLLRFLQRWAAERDPLLMGLLARASEATPVGAFVTPLAKEVASLAEAAEKRRGPQKAQR